jgi:hypothetical protein
MATEPRLPTQWYDGEGPERPSDEPPAMLAEIEALRSRVAAQDAELTRMARDAAWLARLARGSSWPGEMAQRVEDAADRVIAWAEQAAVTSTAGTDAP